MAGGSDQTNAANYIPVRLSDGAAFYDASGGGGGGAGGGGPWPPFGGTSLGFISVAANTAYTLDPPGGATYALVQAINADYNWLDTGGTPTGDPGGGFTLFSGQSIPLAETSISTIQFIVATGQSGNLNILYYSL